MLWYYVNESLHLKHLQLLHKLQNFQVLIVGDKIHVKAKKSVLENAKRVKAATVQSGSEKTSVLIIGGGNSGFLLFIYCCKSHL